MANEEQSMSVMVHRTDAASWHKLDEHEDTYVLDMGNIAFFIKDHKAAIRIATAASELAMAMVEGAEEA